MKPESLSRPLEQQRGISLLGLIVGVALLGVLGLIGAQVVPAVLEFRAVQKAVVAAAKEGSGTAIGIQQDFDKRAAVEDIRSITGRDLVIERSGGKARVSFAYEKRIGLFGPASLVLDFKGSSDSR